MIRLPRTRDNAHVNPEPNPDGTQESIINDPKGTQMGVVTGSLQPGFNQSQNPYHVGDKDETPESMKKFEHLTRGKKLDEI
jgi:hypothetical protein